jgi:Na+-transporting methylmalonyl-CoA/oxaloacetate decarboxylase gamma subunit
MSLADLRDIVIVVYGVLGIVLLLVLIVLAFTLWLIARRLSRTVQDLIREPVRPTLEELQRTAQNIRGASDFMVDRAVHPVIRVLAVARGARRGAGALTGPRSKLRR